MNHTFALTRQLAEDRRMRIAERHPKPEWNRRGHRAARLAARGR